MYAVKAKSEAIITKAISLVRVLILAAKDINLVMAYLLPALLKSGRFSEAKFITKEGFAPLTVELKP